MFFFSFEVLTCTFTEACRRKVKVGIVGGFSLQSTSFPFTSKRLTRNLGVLAAFGVVFGQVGDIAL